MDPRAGLTLKHTIAPATAITYVSSQGAIVADSMWRSGNAVMSFNITIPADPTTPHGVVVHGGASYMGFAAYFYSRAGGDFIVWWGSGAALPNTGAVADQYAISDFPRGESCRITIEIDLDANTTRVWVNNDLLTPVGALSAGTNTAWCGTAGGGYGTADTANPMTWQAEDLFNGTFDGDLEYYDGQLSAWGAGADGPTRRHVWANL